MSDSQFSFLVFFVVGIGYAYKGLALLFQSLHQEKDIIWYKRIKLPRGLSSILLGLETMITTVIVFTDISMPLGDIGWDLMFVLFVISMILLGILAWWNKSHPFAKNREGRPTEDVHD